jgi:hypothetical protein
MSDQRRPASSFSKQTSSSLTFAMTSGCSEVISRTRGVVEARTTHEREVRCSNPGVSKVLQAIAAVDGM